MATKSLRSHSVIEAIIDDDADSLCQLLESGEDPNMTIDWAKITPLHFAAQNNAFRAVEILLRAGANVSAKTLQGETPYDVAILHNNFSLAKYLKQHKDATLH